MSQLEDLMVTLVEDLTASLDTVTGEWKPCWSEIGSLPANATTGIAYKGVNVLLLWAHQLRAGYSRPMWATYKQWLANDGQVRKGEHGVHCIKWVEPKPGEPAEDGTPAKRKGLIPKAFVVFNIDQQDGYELPPVEQELATTAFEAWQTMVGCIPAEYIVGRPCYVPARDVIALPEQFDNNLAAAATWSHELAHWTGHSTRLNRDLAHRFGSEAYAAEELVAEISAAFTCATFQLGSPPQRDDHARYIKNWLAVLGADPKLLLTAAQHAQKATNYLLDFQCQTSPLSTSALVT